MAHSENLAKRIRLVLREHPDVTEKRMFGGLAFLLRGNMICGVTRDDLMVRVGPEAYEQSLARPHARPMDFTGRPMKGMVFVGPDGYREGADLRSWVELALTFAEGLPAK